MPATIDPTRINQQPVDTGQEVTPDGNPIQQAAAPQGLPRIAPQQQAPEQGEEQQLEQEQQVEQTKTKEEPVIDLTDFLAAKNDGVKPVEVKKEEITKDVQTVPPAEQQKQVQTQQQQKPVKIDPNARDYTGIEELDVPLFKKMHNDSFDKLKPIYLAHKEQTKTLQQKDTEIAELKKGKVTVPESYYEHPQAFVLTPEFNEIAGKVNKAQTVLQHWEEQLAAVRGGAAKFNMLQVDQNGNFVTQETPADQNADVFLLRAIDFARGQFNEFNSDLKVLAKTYSEKSKDASTWVSNFEKQTFPMFDHQEYGPKLNPLVESTIKNLPAPYRHNPLVRLLAKSLVLNNQLVLHQQQLIANGAGKVSTQQAAVPGQRPKNINPADRAKAGPTAQQAAGDGSSGNGKGEVSMDDFNAVKNS